MPPWARKTPKVTEVLPLLYLHGLSGGDFVPALGQFPGSAAGLPAPVITRLTETWKAGPRAFAARDLARVDYMYLWAGGIHVNLRLEEDGAPVSSGRDPAAALRPERCQKRTMLALEA